MSKKIATPKALRPEEEYARHAIAGDLGVPVEPHDDGSAGGMYDLEIKYPGRPVVPVEVSSDVNGAMLGTLRQLAKKADGGTWPSTVLSRAWVLQTVGTLDVRRLWPALEQQLAVLEAFRVWSFHASKVFSRRIGRQLVGIPMPQDVQAQTELVHLGVMHAQSYVPTGGADGAGVRLMLDGGGGAWGGSADSVAEWISTFVVDPRRCDNLTKLAPAAAAAGEAHLAVFAQLGQVEFSVWRAIEDRDASGVVPRTAPVLPEPLTHLWLFASPGGATGLAWSSAGGWRRFTCPA